MNKEILLDIRIIAATNRDLHQLMKENLFRTDLHYRLNNILIDLPLLSERVEDIPAMVEHFLTNSGNGFNLLLSFGGCCEDSQESDRGS